MDTIKSYYLLPSAIYVDASPCLVTTVLGSCVSVCLIDIHKNIGGINHYMLPLWNGTGLASPKFGNIAIDKLIDKMLSMGCSFDSLKAKVFGGANVLDTNTNFFNVGERNYKFAIETLNTYNIKIVANNLGGENGRKVVFNTFTGEILIKFLNRIPTT